MPTTIFRPTSPTNQNRPTLKISNFFVFCPFWNRKEMIDSKRCKYPDYTFLIYNIDIDLRQINTTLANDTTEKCFEL